MSFMQLNSYVVQALPKNPTKVGIKLIKNSTDCTGRRSSLVGLCLKTRQSDISFAVVREML